MKPKDYIRQGATGSYLFQSGDIFNGRTLNEPERRGRFRVVEARSKDYIIEDIDTNKRIYCDYPKNTKPITFFDGNSNLKQVQTETYESTQPIPGFMRFICTECHDATNDIKKHFTTVTIRFHGF